MYYRIVYFKKGKFKKLKITDNEEECFKIIEKGLPDIKIYKCNKQGNNYSGRQIY